MVLKIGRRIPRKFKIDPQEQVSQFTCSFCGKGFEQKSRIERHIETAHPPKATSAADIETVLKGIHYPKTKKELADLAAKSIPPGNSDMLMLIESLPSRIYRDSAEVAIALGELKSGKRPRSAAQISEMEAPSKKGGRSALNSKKISASGIASLLKGIHFPKSKRGIITHIAKKHNPKKTEIISVLQRISDKNYLNLVQLEKEIGKIK